MQARRETIAQLRADADRLTLIIENMLALSKLELDADPELEPVHIGRLLARVATEYQRR